MINIAASEHFDVVFGILYFAAEVHTGDFLNLAINDFDFEMVCHTVFTEHVLAGEAEHGIFKEVVTANGAKNCSYGIFVNWLNSDFFVFFFNLIFL